MNNVLSTNSAVERMIRHILDYGRQLNTDLLILEPAPGLDQQLAVNYRLPNGQSINFLLPATLGKAVLDNLKKNSGLNNRQNEGHLVFATSSGPSYYTVTAFSTTTGAKLVLQPQNSQPLIAPAHTLGWEVSDFNLVKQTMMSGQGLIIFLGPRLSGKTSSVYSILNTIKNNQLNITTIEDRPKYRLDDINQIERHYSADINQLLRSLAVTDSEIVYLNSRDPQLDLGLVAGLASNKLVLLTLQADNLLSAIQQLTNLSNYSSAIWSQLKLLIHQRLVKKNCPHCLVGNKLDYYTLDDLHNQFELDDTKALRQLDFYVGQGCPNCDYSGYAGQQALFELLAMTPELTVAFNQKKSKSELQELISQTLSASLFEDAFVKAAKGQTSIAQIQALF